MVFNFNIYKDGNFHVRDVGGPHDICAIPKEEKVVVKFNRSWQPMTTSEMKFRRLVGKYIRSGQFVGINNPN